jgi:hypothetical protein
VAKRLLWTLLVVLLASCAGAPTELPPAAPLPRLVTTPALEPWVSQWIAAYHTAQGQLGFSVDVLPPAAALEAVEDDAFGLVVAGIEVPSSWFATPLGIEGIAVLVHPDNPVRNFSISDLASLFAGRVRAWEELGRSVGSVQVVIPLAGDEVRLRFEGLVMQGSSTTSTALLAPSPTAMIAIIAANPQAIGYVPMSQTDEDVRVVRVEDVMPGEARLADGTYPLTLEVIAMAPEEPGGALRDWLAWLQAGQGPDSP